MTVATDIHEATAPAALDVVWGAPAIAAALGRTERATYHMLESGRVPGAAKVCGRWCLSPAAFLAAITNQGQHAA